MYFFLVLDFCGYVRHASPVVPFYRGGYVEMEFILVLESLKTSNHRLSLVPYTPLLSYILECEPTDSRLKKGVYLLSYNACVL